MGEGISMHDSKDTVAQRCPKCWSMTDSYDKTTDMFLCKKCGELFEPKRKKDSKDKMSNEEDDLDIVELDGDDEEESSKKQIESEDLNIFTLLVLSVSMLIPLLNIVALYFIGDSYTKQEYKRYAVCNFVIMLIIHGALLVGIAFNFKEIGEKSLQSRINIVADSIATDWSIARLDEFEMSRVEIKNHNTLEKIEPIIPIDESTVIDFAKEDFTEINGSIKRGSSVINLLSKYDDCDIAILIKTKAMEDRYEDKYRNVGVIVNSAELNRNGNYIVADEVFYSYMLDDYNDLVIESKDDIYNKKYVFYIKEDSQYLVDVLINTDEIPIGFKITEVEVIK